MPDLLAVAKASELHTLRSEQPSLVRLRRTGDGLKLDASYERRSIRGTLSSP